MLFVSYERTFLFTVAPLADLHGGGEAEAGDRHVHGDPGGHLGVLCKVDLAGKFKLHSQQISD